MPSAKDMIWEIKKVYGLNSPRVFKAMLEVPRDVFVPKKYRNMAYGDIAIPIGFKQTISQPYTVAFMTDLLNLKGKEKVLEIGTGSGYQAAVLSRLAKGIYTVEIINALAQKARKIFKTVGYRNIKIKSGTGQWGWEEHAPYDAIVITAAVEKKVPELILDQLKVGGVLVVPMGKGKEAIMTKYTKKSESEYKKEIYGEFLFVPFIEEVS